MHPSSSPGLRVVRVAQSLCVVFCRSLCFLLCLFDHYIVCLSLIYGFWLPLWYLLTIVLSVLWFTASDYPFGIFTLLTIVLSVLLWFTASDYPFGILDLRLLITLLVSFDHCVVCPSLIYGFWLPLWYLRFTASDYPFGIFWPLCCLSFSDFRLLITPLVS